MLKLLPCHAIKHNWCTNRRKSNRWKWRWICWSPLSPSVRPPRLRVSSLKSKIITFDDIHIESSVHPFIDNVESSCTCHFTIHSRKYLRLSQKKTEHEIPCTLLPASFPCNTTVGGACVWANKLWLNSFAPPQFAYSIGFARYYFEYKYLILHAVLKQDRHKRIT